MHLLLILAGTGAVAWALRETELIIPVTLGLIVLLVGFAISPEAAAVIVAAFAAIIGFMVLIMFLPQVLGFILGALILVVCFVAAGAAHAETQQMDFDTCGEIISDIAEMNYYADGYKDVGKPIYIKGREYTIVVFKGKDEVELVCKNETMTITKRPHQVQLEMDIKPAK